MRSRYTFPLAAALLCTVVSSKAVAQNAYLQNLSIARYIKTNTNYPVSAWVRNSTSTPFTQFRMGWRWNGGNVNLGPVQSVGGGGIVTNNYLNHTHPVQLSVPTQGPGILKVWVQVNGDTDQTNDTITITVKPITNWTTKMVMMDTKTATWCQYCPAANTVGNTIDNDPLAVIAKFHASDALSSSSGTSYLSANMNVTFTPAGLLEQGEYGSYTVNSQHNTWESGVAARQLSVSPVSITVAPSFNATSRVLTVPVTANFTYAEAGEYTLNAYILENGVLGAQTNGGAGNNYVHNQVVREVLGGSNGTAGVIPSNPVAGAPYTHTYSFTLPAGWNASNVQVMAYVTRRENGGALSLNATKVSMLPVGIEENNALQASLNVFPNPFIDAMQVELAADATPAFVEIYSLDGRVLAQWERVFAAEPQRFDGLGSLAAGAYVLRVQRGGLVANFRLVKED